MDLTMRESVRWQVKQELQITDASLKDGKAEIPRYRAMYLDSSLKENSGLALQKNKSFRSLVRNMKTVDDNDFEIPGELDNILRGYQKQGFLWIKTLKANGFGGILADDMGLGKTGTLSPVGMEGERGKSGQALADCLSGVTGL
ncbi:MAG: SNF2 helicase associated domain-containing protein [Eisenbergiella sp.]